MAPCSSNEAVPAAPSASSALLTTRSLARKVETSSSLVHGRRSRFSASSNSSAQTDGKVAAMNRRTSSSELLTRSASNAMSTHCAVPSEARVARRQPVRGQARISGRSAFLHHSTQLVAKFGRVLMTVNLHGMLGGGLHNSSARYPRRLRRCSRTRSDIRGNRYICGPSVPPSTNAARGARRPVRRGLEARGAGARGTQKSLRPGQQRVKQWSAYLAELAPALLADLDAMLFRGALDAAPGRVALVVADTPSTWLKRAIALRTWLALLSGSLRSLGKANGPRRDCRAAFR